MATRTTSAKVQAVLPTDFPSTITLTEQISAASVLVDKVATADSTLTSTHLTNIETWLAAHFAAITEAQLLSETIGDGTDKIESKVDLGLNVTRWGQQALALDTSGTLAKAAEGTVSASMKTLDPER